MSHDDIPAHDIRYVHESLGVPAPNTPTRAEHLAWCKERALEYVDAGDANNALGSMTSDLMKHPETADHPGIVLGMMLAMTGNLDDIRKHIEDFN
jgi:hypothetical protein